MYGAQTCGILRMQISTRYVGHMFQFACSDFLRYFKFLHDQLYPLACNDTPQVFLQSDSHVQQFAT